MQRTLALRVIALLAVAGLLLVLLAPPTAASARTVAAAAESGAFLSASPARNGSTAQGSRAEWAKPSDVRRCLRSRWVVFIGDSVARGIFFDLLDLAAASRAADARAAPHAGHSPEYMQGCLQTRHAGAFNRTRCAMWDFALCPSAPAVTKAADTAPTPIAGARRARHRAQLRVCVPGGGTASCREGARAWREPAGPDSVAACGEMRAPAPPDAACPDGATPALRLTFFAKSYVSEPCVDAPLLAALTAAPQTAAPSALVVGVGLWDMLYTRGSAAVFGSGVRALLAGMRAAGVRAPIAWLEVTAIAEAKLPPFKRGIMSTAAAAELNALAAPALREDAAVRVVPLLEPTRLAADLSADGVHYPTLGALAARTLDALCLSSSAMSASVR